MKQIFNLLTTARGRDSSQFLPLALIEGSGNYYLLTEAVPWAHSCQDRFLNVLLRCVILS